MNVNTLTLKGRELSALGSVRPKPSQLFWSGTAPDVILPMPRVAIVGSRKATDYGRSVTRRLASELSRCGVVVISGLAFGIDSCAHRAVLESGGCTVAVLPTPLGNIAPAAHASLAEQILQEGGALVSEYGPGADVYKKNFIARNRIVAALADALVITEAARNSGSLHTARFALEQGKTVMAVPGNINSPASEGCNNLIKSGALPVTESGDIFFALGIRRRTVQADTAFKGTPQQQTIFGLIADGTSQQEELASASRLAPSEVSSALTALELRGYIRPAGAGHWTAY